MKALYVLILFTSLSYADTKDVDITDYSLLHKTYRSISCIGEINQQAMDRCGELSLKKSTSKMNDLLQKLLKNYKSEETELYNLLIISQKKWQHYMKLSCQLETYYSREGSAYSSIFNACLEMKTNERISYLNWMLENP